MSPSPYPTAGSTNWYGTLKAYIDDVGALTYDVTHAPYSAVANGTDSTTAINAAITAANAAGGGTVLIPAAAQPFATGSAVVLKANVTLQIVGTIQALATHTGAGVTATDVSNVRVVGSGTIDMNKAVTANGGSLTNQQAIKVTTSTATAITNVLIRDVQVANCWQRGIEVSALTASSTVTNVVIDHATVTSTGKAGIYAAGLGDATGIPGTSAGVHISRCIVTNSGAEGIQALGLSDLHVDKNRVVTSSSTGHGICIGAGSLGSTTDHCTDFTVTGNRVRGFTAASQWGVVVSARAARFDVSGNDVRGCTGGMTIDVTDPNNPTSILDCYGTVTGNVVLSSTTANGINVNSAKTLTVTGNVSCLNAGSGINLSTSAGVTVTGNIMKANAQNGISIFGTTAGVGGHTVTGNTSTGNNTSASIWKDYFTEATPIVSFFDIQDAAAAVAEVSLSNSTTETTQFTYPVPAWSTQVGKTYRVTAGYLVDNIAGSGTLTLRLRLNTAGVILASWVIPTQAGAVTGQQVSLDLLVTIRTMGASGTLIAMGNGRSQFSASDAAVGGTSQTISTNADNNLILTAQWATANAGNVCKLEVAAVDIVKT